MNTQNRPAVLVVSDDAAELEVIRASLTADFGPIEVSVQSGPPAPAREPRAARVVILAFKELGDARTYQTQQKAVAEADQSASRTIVLCSRQHVTEAYALCKKDIFDDYVVYWPMTLDAPRLAMAVHGALRDLTARQHIPSTGVDVAALMSVARTAEAQIKDALRQGAASLDKGDKVARELVQEIGGVVDAISGELEATRAGRVLPADLLTKFAALRASELDPRLRRVERLLEPAREAFESVAGAASRTAALAAQLGAASANVRRPILVVEDDPTQRAILRHILREQGYEVLLAPSGAVAMTVVQARLPDAIFVDVRLPDINGIELIRRLRSVQGIQDRPIIVITGHSEKDIVLQSAAAGAVDFVVKPFSAQAILNKLTRHLSAGSALPAAGASPAPRERKLRSNLREKAR